MTSILGSQLARRKNMGLIILKIVACVCVTILAGIIVNNGEEEPAIWLMILGLALIFIPWDKIF